MNWGYELRTGPKAPPGDKRVKPRRPGRDEGKDRIYGRNAVVAVLHGKRHVHGILLAEGVGQDSRIATIRELAERRRIQIQTVPVQGIENIVGKVNHQGVLATTDRFGYVALRTILDRPGTVLILDHVTDPQNLGTLLRAARAFEIAGVVIPSDRAASVTPAVVNASAGAVESLPVAQVVNINRAITEIREHGRWVAALDTGSDSRSIFTTEIPLPVALVLGSEGRGVSKQVRASSELVISIPISRDVESLNVATAGSIVLFELARRMHGSPSGRVSERLN
jgi:23S rRNA (guanosine2251-2'-O)-methyltransferase